MYNLKTGYMPANTQRVFEFFAGEPLLKDFTLIGGTALSLQIAHRLSVDLDFWQPSETLNKFNLSKTLKNAADNGLSVKLLMPESKLISAKINGIDLMLYAQDYLIDDVKVTFFARNDSLFSYFDSFERLKTNGVAFSIMSEEGLFAMKSQLIHQRRRSRDLFDLYTWVNRGRSISDLLEQSQRPDPFASIEVAKAVLRGIIAIDKDDEGLKPVGEAIELAEIYAFFKEKISELEIEIAAKIKKEIAQNNDCSDDDRPSL